MGGEKNPPEGKKKSSVFPYIQKGTKASNYLLRWLPLGPFTLSWGERLRAWVWQSPHLLIARGCGHSPNCPKATTFFFPLKVSLSFQMQGQTDYNKPKLLN